MRNVEKEDLKIIILFMLLLIGIIGGSILLFRYMNNPYRLPDSGAFKLKPGMVIALVSNDVVQKPIIVLPGLKRDIELPPPQNAGWMAPRIDWIHFISPNRLILQFGKLIMEYNLITQTNQIIADLGSGRWKLIDWMCPLNDKNQYIFLIKHTLFISEHNTLRRLISTNVNDVEIGNNGYVEILHSDGHLELINIITKQRKYIYKFNSCIEGYGRFAIRDNKTAIADNGTLYIISPKYKQTIKIAGGTLGNLCWMKSNVVVYTLGIGKYTNVIGVNLITKKSQLICTLLGYNFPLSSTVINPKILYALLNNSSNSSSNAVFWP